MIARIRQIYSKNVYQLKKEGRGVSIAHNGQISAKKIFVPLGNGTIPLEKATQPNYLGLE